MARHLKLTNRSDQKKRATFAPRIPLTVDEIAAILLDDLSLDISTLIGENIYGEVALRLRDIGRTYALDVVSMFLYSRGMDGVDSLDKRSRSVGGWACYASDDEIYAARRAAAKFVTSELCESDTPEPATNTTEG